MPGSGKKGGEEPLFLAWEVYSWRFNGSRKFLLLVSVALFPYLGVCVWVMALEVRSGMYVGGDELETATESTCEEDVWIL